MAATYVKWATSSINCLASVRVRSVRMTSALSVSSQDRQVVMSVLRGTNLTRTQAGARIRSAASICAKIAQYQAYLAVMNAKKATITTKSIAHA